MTSYSKSSSCLTINNNILNFNRNQVPLKSKVSVEIALPSSIIDLNKMESFFKKLYDYFQYEYGYVVGLPEDFNFITERKIKNSFFSNSSSFKEIDRIWRFHSVGVNYGYLKNIYPLNILNKSHISQPIIRKCIDNNIGRIKQINDYLNFWYLKNDEVKDVKGFFKKSKYLIADKDSKDYFMKTKEAERFYALMKFK